MSKDKLNPQTIMAQRVFSTLRSRVEMDVQKAIKAQESYIKAHDGADREVLKEQVRNNLNAAIKESYERNYKEQQYVDSTEGVRGTADELLGSINVDDIQDEKIKGDFLTLKAAYEKSQNDLNNCVTEDMLNSFVDGSIANGKIENKEITKAIVGAVLISVCVALTIATMGLGIYIMSGGVLSGLLIAGIAPIVPIIGMAGLTEGLLVPSLKSYDNAVLPENEIIDFSKNMMNELDKRDVIIEQETAAPTQQELNTAVEGVASFTQNAIDNYPKWPDEEVAKDGKKAGGINLEAAQRLLARLEEVKGMLQDLNQGQYQGQTR